MSHLRAGCLTMVILLPGRLGLRAEDYLYQGGWNTTNRRLDGVMTCVVKSTGHHKWQGRFYGNWQGAAFDYTETFTGPARDLRGTASIDGARYEWNGSITPERFRGTFTGDRYKGNFDLARMKTKAPSVAARNFR
jgi:hypothetical protein